MALQLLSASIAATLLILVTTIIVLRHRLSASVFSRAVRNDDDLKLDRHMTELSGLISSLASALPNSVVLPQDTFEFKKSLHSYWAQQECEVIPACVVRPESAQQLSTIVTILKQEYHRRTSQAGQKESRGFFAVRSGGHSPVPGAASVEGGIVIDLCRLREVTTTDNGTCTTIGAGCRWIDVSSVLDKKGLAVVGGRNSAVGVGGLTLGGENCLLIMSRPHHFLGSRPQSWHQEYEGLSIYMLKETIDRRSFLFLPRLWPRLLQCNKLRDRPRLRCHYDSICLLQS